jgi:hypothetical protein
MQWTSSRVRVSDEPVQFGDVPLAPPAATGRSEAELARAMADRLLAAPQSDTEALKILRDAFPHHADRASRRPRQPDAARAGRAVRGRIFFTSPGERERTRAPRR